MPDTTTTTPAEPFVEPFVDTFDDMVVEWVWDENDVPVQFTPASAENDAYLATLTYAYVTDDAGNWVNRAYRLAADAPRQVRTVVGDTVLAAVNGVLGLRAWSHANPTYRLVPGEF